MQQILTLIILILFLASCGMSRKIPNINLLEIPLAQPYDAIIVPGIPFDGDTWSSKMSLRVYWSVYLYKNGYAKNIIYSGSSVYSKFVEAKIMALYAIELGVPSENIFLETMAEHSVENVYNSYRIAKQNEFKKIALTTDEFQSKSMKKFVLVHELPIDFLPAVFDSVETQNKVDPTIISSSAISLHFESIKEREGFFKRLSGTFGKNIIWYEDDLPNQKLISKYEKREQLIRDSSQEIDSTPQ